MSLRWFGGLFGLCFVCWYAACGAGSLGVGEPCAESSVCGQGLACVGGVCARGDASEPAAPAEPSLDVSDGDEPSGQELPSDGVVEPDAAEPVHESGAEGREAEPTQEAPLPDVVVSDGPPQDGGSGWLTLRLQAIRVSHDDGSRRASVEPGQVAQWVAESNKIYQTAKLSFLFDPKRDFADVKSTLLNRIDGHQHPDWTQAVAEGNKLAASYPGKFIAIFRHGRDANPTGGGFGWTDYDFFVMPGFDKTFVCGHQNITLFAHELGHFLGLRHTFQQIYQSNAAAQQAWDQAKDPAVFDGDGLSDTLPDPFSREFQCSGATHMTLSGQRFAVPLDNIMSYHDSAQKTLTPQQIAIIRQVVLLRSQKDIKALVPGATIVIEGEALKQVSSSQGRASSQQMRGFHGRWSQDAQLWWPGGGPGQRLTLSFPVAAPGSYRVYAIFTKARDFGIHTPALNGSDISPIDLHSKYVHHTAPIDLGTHALKTTNELTFAVQGKATASLGHALGLDALLLKPMP